MLIPLLVLGFAVFMIAWESLTPGRRWPAVKGWWMRALLLNGFQAAAVWLGSVFQRPESHCVHHQEGVHSFNYSDLPLWDMLLGVNVNAGTEAERAP
jgi:sterol desaturase/sphingolipid hydroxylase (fatty acid hydroxylase superfamily)